MSTRLKYLIATLSLIFLLFSSVALAEDNLQITDEQYEADTEEVVEEDIEDIYDPWEGFNRAMFWFNDTLDVYLLEPVAQGYRAVTPEIARKGVGNFFDNLRYPRYLVSSLAQGKFSQAFKHTRRFLVNTTVGIGGVVDVAAQMGLKREYEDFGIALAYHEINPGPYLVLPILGPSNVRDGLGRIVDYALSPTTYISSLDLHSDTETALNVGLFGLEVIDTREGLIESIESAKETSLDYYLFVRKAYSQIREGILHDGRVPQENIFNSEWAEDEPQLDEEN